MARSRRLGIAGEVSVGPDREVHKNISRCHQARFFQSRFFPIPFFAIPFFPIPVFARIRTGVFLIGKTIIGRFSNKKLLEQRPMILFRIRSCARPGFVRARRGRGIFFYTEIADLCRLGFIYTEFAGRLRVRRMVASGGWLRPGNFLGKNLGGRNSARVFATQRSRIRGDWILSTQRLPIHWSLRGYNFFSALRADEKGVCICVYNRN